MKRKFAHLAKSGYVGGQCKTDCQTKKGFRQTDRQTAIECDRQKEREGGYGGGVIWNSALVFKSSGSIEGKGRGVC
jgi:hypothetical protein